MGSGEPKFELTRGYPVCVTFSCRVQPPAAVAAIEYSFLVGGPLVLLTLSLLAFLYPIRGERLTQLKVIYISICIDVYMYMCMSVYICIDIDIDIDIDS